MSFKELPPITAGALATATLMYPVDLVRALKMSAAAEGKGGTAMTLIKDFHAVRESPPPCSLCACAICPGPAPAMSCGRWHEGDSSPVADAPARESRRLLGTLSECARAEPTFLGDPPPT
jgi:hypothetical protein